MLLEKGGVRNEEFYQKATCGYHNSCADIFIFCGYAFYQANSFKYTNLADDVSRDYMRSLLEEADISQENIDLLLRLVDEFYQAPYPNAVENGFQKALISLFSYNDTDAFQHLELQPENSLTCRMAAFILLRDRITFPDHLGDGLELDEKDPKSRRILIDSSDLLHYDLLFANLSNQSICSSAEMVDVLTEYWESSGVVFPMGQTANIVMAYGSDGELIQNFHTAVVIQGEQEVWLLEKYDPIYPYQLSCFSGERQLVSYMKLRLAGSKYAAIFLGNDCLWSKK